VLRTFVRRSIKLLAGLSAFIILSAFAAPYALDRIYYSGPKSDHFDGQYFFNPDGDDAFRSPAPRTPYKVIWSFLTGSGRPAWPDHVAVTPTKPPARVEGERLIATWVGHATVLLQTEGLNILTDPNWAETTGPFGIGPSRVAEPGIKFADLPHIDAVLISHNHYDHLDVPTLQRLQARDHPRIFTGLGNDNLLAQSGVKALGMDWTQHATLAPNIEIITTRNHHWGGRWGYDAKRALWTAFIIKTPHGNLFFAGDTGAGDMKWPVEAASYGPIRLALIPIGAFRFAPGQMANGSHIGPVDAVRVFERLGAQQAIAVHWGTFHLSSEAYNTPPTLLAEVMKCHAIDPARFSAVGFGVQTEVAVLSTRLSPKLNTGNLRCLESSKIAALK
jgi:L-ascorbate metabolism protein UlaG (beta-lactamase superfamily)